MSERCQLKDLTGQRFGKLTVISRNKDNSKSGNARWNCLCDCGNTAIVIGSKLRSGYTKSCGCARKSDVAQGYAGTRLYKIWRGMFRRCYKKDSDNYKYYGGRGITICKEWREFIVFRNWALSNGYADNLTIDRIDPNKKYSPNNCRWATIKEQQNNKTNNSYLEYKGKSFTYSQFADYLHVPYWTIVNQLKLGWTIEKIANKAKERNAR
jgi:hypothetical protein